MNGRTGALGCLCFFRCCERGHIVGYVPRSGFGLWYWVLAGEHGSAPMGWIHTVLVYKIMVTIVVALSGAPYNNINISVPSRASSVSRAGISVCRLGTTSSLLATGRVYMNRISSPLLTCPSVNNLLQPASDSHYIGLWVLRREIDRHASSRPDQAAR